MAEFNKNKNRNFSNNIHQNNNRNNFKFDKDFDNKDSFEGPRKPRPPKSLSLVVRKPVKHIHGVEVPEFAGKVIEYKMSAAMADTILKSDKTKRTPQEVLCEYVNTQCGLKGFCVRVSYF